MTSSIFLPFILVFAIALLVSAGRTLRCATRFGPAARPGRTGRAGAGSIAGVVPRLGGIAMYVGFHRWRCWRRWSCRKRWFPPRLDPNELTRLTGLLIGTTSIFLFGLVDDRLELPSRPQYAGPVRSPR